MPSELSLSPELEEAPEVEETEEVLNYKQISKYLLKKLLSDAFPEMEKLNLKYLANIFLAKMYYNVEYDIETERLIKNLNDVLNKI